jgi:hypothetical protein
MSNISKNELIIMFTEIILFSIFCVWILFILYHDHEGLSFTTFVRNPLYPKGNNYSKDEGFWYLTFCVALFLIHSIWERVPNNAYYSPQLVERWTYVSSLLLSHTPTGQEQVPQDEAHGGCCAEFVRGLGHHLPVNFRLLDRCLLMM